ncbi:MAG: hypothetical protein ACRDYC_00655, partial [Acidimicrobiales bacterium]
MACMLLLSAGGGLLALAATIALAFVGTAALAAWLYTDLKSAVAVALLGPITVGIGAPIGGKPVDLVLGGGGAAITGLAMGLGRRRAIEKVADASRIEMEHVRAETMAERNRLAR